MRFAFCGYDYSIDLAQTLMAQGHELMALFTFPCDQVFAHNLQTYALADSLKLPNTEERITAGHIDALLRQGCEAILVAGYPHKIPPIDPKRAYGLNLHPALLPRARGVTPLPYILMQEPEAAGFTIHKLSPVMDGGDILYQEAIAIAPDTDVEVLSARVAVCARSVIGDVFADLPGYWARAKPQDESKAGYYPPVDTARRSLDWAQDVSSLLRRGRAFGRYGVVATVQNNEGEQQNLGVFALSGWVEPHELAPGHLLRSGPREIVVAARDGFICLKEFQVIG